MSATVHVFDYLAAVEEHPPRPVCVVFGDDRFLKRIARRAIQSQVAGAADEEAPFASFEGPEVQWRDVGDELATVSLFGRGRRLAVVRDADEFVARYRARLERYVEAPCRAGVLLLELSAWPANTRLYAAVGREGLAIECRRPEKPRGKRKTLDENRLRRWLAEWAASQHNIQLKPEAAAALFDLIGPEFGLLDSELSKLALLTDPGGEVTAEMVADIVGGWRTKTIWELLDAATEGNAAEAMRQLDRLLHSGENPIGLFGQIAWSLRRFADATRIYQRAERAGRPVTVRSALQEAGFRPWPKGALEKAERQLRQLGRERAAQLPRWLLDADLAMKGSHSSPARARLVLERLLVRLSRELGPARSRR